MFRRRRLPRKYLYFILLLAVFSVLFFAQQRDSHLEEGQVLETGSTATVDASGALIPVTPFPTATSAQVSLLPAATDTSDSTDVPPTEPPTEYPTNLPSPEPSAGAISSATQSPVVRPPAIATATARPETAASPTRPTPTAEGTATQRPDSTQAATVSASPTSPGAATPIPTATPLPTIIPTGGISGRITYNGSPAAQGLTLILEEDRIFSTVTSIKVGAEGRFTFSGIPVSENGFNVLFAQEWNGSIYDIDQVISWGWIGPIDVISGQVLQLPDFEIGQRGFSQKSPASDASFSAASISAASPLTFEWTAYQPGTSNWVDLTRGEAQTQVWQSDLISGTTIAFDGTLTDGSHITPGEYWWGVGAFSDIGDFTQTIYGYLFHFTVTQ